MRNGSTREAMKTFVNEDGKSVAVVINDCQNDAIDTIVKRFNAEGTIEYALMHNSYAGVAKCDDEDTFDVKVGGNLASYKAMKSHKAAHSRAIKRWQKVMMDRIRNVNPETFDEIINSMK